MIAPAARGREDSWRLIGRAEEKAYLATTGDDLATRVVWAGQDVNLVNDIPAASAIIERIIAEAVATLTEGAALIRR